MKYLFSLLTVLFIGLNSFSQDDCKPFYPMAKGYTWQYEEFDNKGELTGTNTTSVESIKVEDAKVIYTMKGVVDGPKKKEKNHYEDSFTYTCENGVLKLGLENMIPQETMNGMKDMEMEITQTEMMIPSELKVGDKLNDAEINMKVSSSGKTVMNMTVTITNRLVEKTESVTTESGTYECVVISFKSTLDMGIMQKEHSGKEWFSPSVGLVKSENYNSKGELESSNVLKSFTTGN